MFQSFSSLKDSFVSSLLHLIKGIVIFLIILFIDTHFFINLLAFINSNCLDIHFNSIKRMFEVQVLRDRLTGLKLCGSELIVSGVGC